MAPDIANSNLATDKLSVISYLFYQVHYHISFLNSNEIKFECYTIGKEQLEYIYLTVIVASSHVAEQRIVVTKEKCSVDDNGRTYNTEG